MSSSGQGTFDIKDFVWLDSLSQTKLKFSPKLLTFLNLILDTVAGLNQTIIMIHFYLKGLNNLISRILSGLSTRIRTSGTTVPSLHYKNEQKTILHFLLKKISPKSDFNKL